MVCNSIALRGSLLRGISKGRNIVSILEVKSDHVVIAVHPLLIDL